MDAFPPAILVVDDVPANILAMEAALESVPCRVLTARSGTEALQRLLEHDVALVFLDVQMPGMDGYETARWIRSRERSKHLPIIFVTAHDAEHQAVLDAYALGAVDFLFKPLHSDILRAKARAFVELARAHSEQREQAARPRSLRILLVEDDEDIRMLTIDLLALRGHIVDATHDGPSALAKLCTTEPDVALIDLGLPGLDGYSLAKTFRAVRPDSKTRLVAITGYGTDADRTRTQNAGFAEHLVKPVNLAALEQALSQLDT